ncbi:Uncharacterised protein [Yersinia enterocolitica]|nr:Uncharacterised protein [Yersinia enterocolitica]
MPPPEEQGDYQCRDGHDADVFTDKEQTEFHAGIFNVVTIGQFLFSFWLVKGMTVTNSNTRNGEG